MWPANTCGKCKVTTAAPLAKVTCVGCGRVGCVHCMGAKTAEAGKCRFCIREMPEYKAAMGIAR